MVGSALKGRRDEVVVATKFGIVAPSSRHAHRVDASHRNEIWIDGRPERVRAAAHGSRARLGVDAIDRVTVASAVGVLLLSTAVVLAVYKPWGQTRFRR